MPRYSTNRHAAKKCYRVILRKALPELEAEMTACIRRALNLGGQIVELRTRGQAAEGRGPSYRKRARGIT